MNPITQRGAAGNAPTTFKEFSQLGYRLVPIIPPDAPISATSSLYTRVGTSSDSRGKAVGVKGRDGLWSGFDWIPHEADGRDLDRWTAMRAGVGIRTGQGLIAIDADTLVLEHAQTIRVIVEKFVGVTSARIGRRPKCLYPVRISAPMRYARVEFGELDEKGRLKDRVEILSDDRQFVAYGVHPGTKQPYAWPRPLVPFDQLPVVAPETILAMLEELRGVLPAAKPIVREGGTSTVNQEALKGDLQTVRRAVAATPNTSKHFPTRESYRDFGYGIKAALANHEAEAFEIFSEWCQRWVGEDGQPVPDGNDPGVVESDWRRMKPPFRRGSPWLYEIAEKYGDGTFSRAEMWFHPIETSEPLFDAPASDRGGEIQPFELITLQDAAKAALTHSNKALVKGLLDQGALSVCYGDSNVGKTFVAMDIAFAVAAGLPWGNMRTAKSAVVYVAAEGGGGAKKRSLALLQKYGAATFNAAAFHFRLSGVNLLKADADLQPLIQTILQIGQGVGLVVIDTLSRAMAGGDENASTDMGAMVKHLDAIRTTTGAHVMAIHHTGKDKAKGARGHSLLRAATDTEIEISAGRIAVTKQRDMDKNYGAGFALDVHKLGIDPDGDPVTSCTVRLVSLREVRAEPNAAEVQILDALDDAILADAPGKGAETRDIATAMRHRGNSGATGESVRNHLRRLEEKNLVLRLGRGRWARSIEPAVPSDFFTPITVSDGAIEFVGEDKMSDEPGSQVDRMSTEQRSEAPKKRSTVSADQNALNPAYKSAAVKSGQGNGQSVFV